MLSKSSLFGFIGSPHQQKKHAVQIHSWTFSVRLDGWASEDGFSLQCIGMKTIFCQTTKTAHRQRLLALHF